MTFTEQNESPDGGRQAGREENDGDCGIGDAEILPPESTIDRLARVLFDKMEHLDPSPEGDGGWVSLTEHEKDFYRTCVEAVLANYSSPRDWLAEKP